MNKNCYIIFFPPQRQLNVRGFQCSNDLRYVLFKHNVKHVSKPSLFILILILNTF